MKFGLCARTAAERGRDEDHAHRLIVEESVLAEEEGFDSVWFTPGAQLSGASGFVLAAAVARRTRAIRLVVRPPLGLTHPLYTAEDAAALDLISGGRAILAPPGAPSAAALAAYGIEPDAASERTWETIEVLGQAWAPEPFRHDGQAWTIPAGLPDHNGGQPMLSVTPKPAQPTVPIWAAPTSEEGVRRAAQLGLPVVAESWLTRAEVGALFTTHAEHAPASARSIRAAIRDVHVAETAGSHASDPAIAGDVEAVIDELHRYAEVGVNYIVCRIATAGLEAARVQESMLLLARAVAPLLRMYAFPDEIRVRTVAEASDPMLGYLKAWS